MQRPTHVQLVSSRQPNAGSARPAPAAEVHATVTSERLSRLGVLLFLASRPGASRTRTARRRVSVPAVLATPASKSST